VGKYIMREQKRVVIIGAGFAGLKAAQTLAHQPIEVILIDKNNYHTFTPLLYQVATCGLDPSAVAYPIRSILRDMPNVHFLLGTVSDVDHENQVVIVEAKTGEVRHETYDYLFVAAGSKTNYFGNEVIEQNSFGLRDLNDAIAIRHHILKLFEKAAWTTNDAEREALMTLVVVGGGATGLETAGALHELYNNVLDKEYDKHDNMQARVILLEAADNVLPPYPDKLRDAAKKQLEAIGIEVHTGAFVEKVDDKSITLRDGTSINTHTIVWATGIVGSPLARMLDVELDKNGRVPVTRSMEIIGRERIFAAGDMTYLLQPDSHEAYPGLIPVAQQQATIAAKNIIHTINGEAFEEFVYNDKGIMATIGRRRAVVWLFNRMPLSGFLAWLAWLGFHLIMLMGMRNRVQVFLNWVWEYLFYDRSVRLIIEDDKRREVGEKLFKQNGDIAV
jgi:NADH:quinone reductase (non-electrogenic)